MLYKQLAGKIREIIQEKDPVVIVSHMNPDGDGVGSAVALALFLRKYKVPVHVIIPNNVPEFLNWLPGYEMVNIFQKKKQQCRKLLKDATTAIFVDFNDPERTGNLKEDLLAANAYKILIDHHQRPEEFADMVLSEPGRGSVGEMIYLLITHSAGAGAVDRDIATCLYVAIMTDTGNFRYASSYSEIFGIAGALVDTGIDKDKIYSNIYDSYSENRMKMMGYCMSEKLVVLKELNAAYIYLDKKELKRFDHQVGDTEGFVNIPFSIKGVRLSALFIEKNANVKISFRSKGSVSVDKIAAEHFNGGGHVNAAGGEDTLTLKETIAKFESVLKLYSDELTGN
jgi:bifunctional oligoribonuclease and PAP phosphatase NrnA